MNDFISSLLPSTRHFDMKLWTALYVIQPRTEKLITNLFFSMRGGIEITRAPVEGAQRSTDFLVELTDVEFLDVYKCALILAALSFTLMSRGELQRFTSFALLWIRCCDEICQRQEQQRAGTPLNTTSSSVSSIISTS